jgi:glycosyltransferase involved in cell wall biosynthesis
VRVLLVSQEYPPETGWGGIGTYLGVISHALAEAGAEVHVLSAVEGQTRREQRDEHVTVHRFGLPRVRGAGRISGCPQAWQRAWLAACTVPLVARLPTRPTVVECPEWRAEGLGLTYRRAFPVVVRVHSAARQLFRFTGQGRGRRGLDGRLAAALEDSSTRRAHLVTGTASNLDEVIPALALDPDATRTISYPLRFAPPPPLPSGGAPRVAFVGRFEPRKGPEVLLSAVPRVLTALPTVRFRFVGRDGVGPGTPASADWLREEAQRLGIAHAVTVEERWGKAAVADTLAMADVCAFPSRWESFGYGLAEAAAAGRPVVASDIPPFRELVDDGSTGRLVASDDAEAWADSLISVLADRDRAATMGAAGAALVRRVSDPARVAELTLAAYEVALDRWRTGLRAGRRSRVH